MEERPQASRVLADLLTIRGLGCCPAWLEFPTDSPYWRETIRELAIHLGMNDLSLGNAERKPQCGLLQ